jgi:hypothetical protein
MCFEFKIDDAHNFTGQGLVVRLLPRPAAGRMIKEAGESVTFPLDTVHTARFIGIRYSSMPVPERHLLLCYRALHRR